MNERIEAAVSGRVQGVMYRDFATRKARRLGLVGRVRNLPDGTVSVIAEGPHDQLLRYVAKLRKGSLLSRVENVSYEFKNATGEFSAFEITYD